MNEKEKDAADALLAMIKMSESASLLRDCAEAYSTLMVGYATRVEADKSCGVD